MMNPVPQPSPDFYIAGGTLDSTAPSYIVRDADKELLDAVKAGQFCYILTSRQMGKSSLMVRTASHLQESGILSIIIDLSDRDTTCTDSEKWYLAQVLEIAEQLGFHEDYLDWWQKQSQWGVVQRLTQFLIQIVLKKITQPIVIFIDEIDSTLSLPFNCDDYFAMIRGLYNKRAVNPVLKQLTFVLLGVASPSDLTKDARRTPFNIGTRIQLTDFTMREAQPLMSGLVYDQKLAEKILENILLFTGGHPYLTQKVCLHIAKGAKFQWNETEAPHLIRHMIYEIFISEIGYNTDDNIQFIRKRILSSKSNEQLLQNYTLIRQKQIVLDNELDPLLMELKLSGLVKNDAGILVVRNIIYESVFDEIWIRKALSELTLSNAQNLTRAFGTDETEKNIRNHTREVFLNQYSKYEKRRQRRQLLIVPLHKQHHLFVREGFDDTEEDLSGEIVDFEKDTSYDNWKDLSDITEHFLFRVYLSFQVKANEQVMVFKNGVRLPGFLGPGRHVLWNFDPLFTKYQIYRFNMRIVTLKVLVDGRVHDSQFGLDLKVVAEIRILCRLKNYERFLIGVDKPLRLFYTIFNDVVYEEMAMLEHDLLGRWSRELRDRVLQRLQGNSSQESEVEKQIGIEVINIFVDNLSNNEQYVALQDESFGFKEELSRKIARAERERRTILSVDPVIIRFEGTGMDRTATEEDKEGP